MRWLPSSPRASAMRLPGGAQMARTRTGLGVAVVARARWRPTRAAPCALSNCLQDGREVRRSASLTRSRRSRGAQARTVLHRLQGPAGSQRALHEEHSWKVVLSEASCAPPAAFDVSLLHSSRAVVLRTHLECPASRHGRALVSRQACHLVRRARPESRAAGRPGVGRARRARCRQPELR